MTLPAALLERVRARAVVLVVGDGPGLEAGGAGWAAVARALAARAEDTGVQALLTAGRVSAALALARARLGDEARAIAAAQTARSISPTPAALAAAAGPWRCVVTTALDDQWETALGAAAEAPLRVRSAGDPDGPLLADGRLLVHLLGHAAAPASICLGPEDLRAGVGSSGLGVRLAELARRWSLVFVGFQPDAPDLAWAISVLAPAASPLPQFLLLPGVSGDDAAAAGAAHGLLGLAGAATLNATLEALAMAGRDAEPIAAGAEPDGAQVERLFERLETARAPGDQLVVMRELARAFEEGGDPGRAYTTLASALRLPGADLLLVDELVRVARRAGQLGPFLAEYAAFVADQHHPAQAMAHGRLLARLQGESPEGRNTAIDTLRTLLARHEDGDTRAELAERLGASGRWTEAAAEWQTLADAQPEVRARWDALGRTFDRAAEGQTGATRGALLVRAAVVYAERLDDPAGAETRWAAAIAADPEQTAAAEPLAQAHERAGRWRELAPVLALLARRTHEPRTAAGLHLRLARCEEALGADDAAMARYAEALTLDPSRRDALEGLIALHDRRGDLEAAVAERRRLLPLVSPPERPALLERLGDTLLRRLHRPDQALTAYREALAAEPSRWRALHGQLDAQAALGDWSGSVDTLSRLAATARTPDERARLRHAAAVILRDELADPDGALALLEQALDEAPGATRSEEAALRLLEARSDLPRLLSYRRRALERLTDGASDADRAALWRSLGDLAGRLGDRETAAAALEAADALAPGDATVEADLRGLYVELGPAAIDRAAIAYQRLVDREPDRPEHHRALAQLHAESGDAEGLFWAASALVALDAADSDLRRVWEQGQAAQAAAARGALDAAAWEALAHPDEDAALSALFAAASPALPLLLARTHRAAGLDPGARLVASKGRSDAGPPTRSGLAAQWFPALALGHASRALGLPPPELFLRPDAVDSALLENLRRGDALTPALVLGGRFPERPEPELLFELAHATALTRPQWFARVALPTRALLELALRAALILAGGKSDDPEATRLARQLGGGLGSEGREALASAAARVRAQHGDGPQLETTRWLAAGELGAARAALAIGGDLPTAVRLVGVASPAAGLSAKERQRDLLSFAVSREHLAVRGALGGPAPARATSTRGTHASS